jgi:hypothetical protein
MGLEGTKEHSAMCMFRSENFVPFFCGLVARLVFVWTSSRYENHKSFKWESRKYIPMGWLQPI